jgi:hypothetical protein
VAAIEAAFGDIQHEACDDAVGLFPFGKARAKIDLESSAFLVAVPDLLWSTASGQAYIAHRHGGGRLSTVRRERI